MSEEFEIEKYKHSEFILESCPEWQLLRAENMSLSPEAVVKDDTVHPEELRTGSSEHALRNFWVGGPGAYEALTEGQNPEKKLKAWQFQEMHQWVREVLPDEKSYEAMQYIMLIHDIGKNPNIASKLGVDLEAGDDHDEVVRRLFSDEYREVRAELLPTFEKEGVFDEEQKKFIVKVLSIPLNFPGYIQSQLPAIDLEALPEDMDMKVKAGFILHAALDIAGARGAENTESALMWDVPTHDRIMDAKHALLATDPEDLGLPAGTELTPFIRDAAYLSLRALRMGQDLHELAYDVDKRAQVRLANMARFSTPEEFEKIATAYQELSSFAQFVLATEVNKYGGESIDGPALNLDCGPALMKALEAGPEGMKAALTYIAAVLEQASYLERPRNQRGSLMVALKDMVTLAKHGELDPHAPLRLVPHGQEAVIPETITPSEADRLQLERLLRIQSGVY